MGFAIYLIALAVVLFGIITVYALCALSVYLIDKLVRWRGGGNG